MRRAFTLVELMTAAAISAVVLAAVASSFMSSIRMLATAMAEAELSLSARELREKLLFRAAPSIDGTLYAGILSGTNAASVVEGGATPNIQMSCIAYGENFGDRRSQSMRIMLGSGGTYLVNERIPGHESHMDWLRPGGFPLKCGAMSDIVSHESYNGSVESMDDICMIYIDIALSYGERYAGGEVVRRERIAAPVLGGWCQPFSVSRNGVEKY